MKIQEIIDYILQFKDIKYHYCDESSFEMVLNIAPFWIGYNTNLIPSFETLRSQGLNCVGLTNLVRRKLRLPIPGLEEPDYDLENKKVNFIGGTENWFHYLRNKNLLHPINFQAVYPKGTLLIQDYNLEDQGHVGIIVEQGKTLLESQLL